MATVRLSQMDLWCHVALSPKDFGEANFFLEVGCKAEIYNFSIELLVEKYVLWFHV